ncbi:hypothetical protein V6N13_121289 [Hibiscus sabdariffa]|uniref:Uncharacterized protein n=1 Tax=Hibiscus sabdariffa TaxID=183260 RepID=A0ABR2AAH9_9ROSI
MTKNSTLLQHLRQSFVTESHKTESQVITESTSPLIHKTRETKHISSRCANTPPTSSSGVNFHLSTIQGELRFKPFMTNRSTEDFASLIATMTPGPSRPAY